MCLLFLLLFSAPAGAQTPGAVEELPPAIVLKYVVAQTAPILDVAIVNSSGLLILDRSGLTRYELETYLSNGQTVPRMRRIESAALPARVWPRDLRGHLVMNIDQLRVFLPGTDCTVQNGPLRMACVDRRVPWPLLLPNSGLEPDRNYFTTPEGMTFYGASPIASDAEGFVVADGQGRLTQLDANRRPVADLGSGDDVVALRSPCGAGRWYYLAASRSGAGDVLRAFVVERGRLVPGTPDLPLPGAFAALSSVDGRTFVITRLPILSVAYRYDAFQVDISCGR